ncbi:IS110 family transposase [Cryptosporangium phraense]|nr:IS110 family transposase [Cryptosporangium phraense]
MDPHKRSVTIEVMASDETVVGGGRFETTVDGYAAMKDSVAGWPERVWAIEGCNGIGKHIAARLISDGEQVIDVPPKLSARTGVFATGQGRKTDATDAHSVALVGTRMAGLHPVVDDQQLAVLQTLVDRRRSLGEDHTRMISQLHALLLLLIPGGAKTFLSAAQAKKLLADVRPTDPAGKARHRVAAELITDLERIYQRSKNADKELRDLVRATGTNLLDLHGIGPSGAARLLVEVSNIQRFPTRAHFGSWTGTAPIDASSYDHVHHRLSCGGNRQINRVLHTMATVQLRNPTAGRVYYDRRRSEGKTSNEAMRALKRRLSDVVYRTMLRDARNTAGTAREDNRGRHLTAARPTPTPTSTLRKSHFPDPSPTTLRPRLDLEGCHESEFSAGVSPNSAQRVRSLPSATMAIAVEVAQAVTPELVRAFDLLLPQLDPSAAPLNAAAVDALVRWPGNRLLVARVDGEIAGVLMLVMFPIATGTQARIEDVVVDKASRKRGIGAALTMEAVRLAREAGAHAVDLTSHPSRQHANRLYQRLGFQRSDTNVYWLTL